MFIFSFTDLFTVLPRPGNRRVILGSLKQAATSLPYKGVSTEQHIITFNAECQAGRCEYSLQ